MPADLVPLCLMSFYDELRPEARETISEFERAGIEIKIISGDNPHTVAALAQQAGFGGDGEPSGRNRLCCGPKKGRRAVVLYRDELV